MNKKAFFITTILSVVALASCGKKGENSVSPSIDGSLNNSTTPPITHTISEALQKDYSNMTAHVSLVYGGGSEEEYFIEYFENGFTSVYTQLTAEMGFDPWLFYHDYQDDNYLYFSPDQYNPQGAWLNKGVDDRDLSLEGAYFSMDVFLENISAADVELQGGIYYVKESAMERLNETVFAFAWDNEVVGTAILLNEQGYVSKILGFETSDKNKVQIELGEFGTTVTPTQLPPAPTSETVKEYWEYKGEDKPYENKYIESINVAVKSEVETEGDFSAVLDIEDVIELEFSYLPIDANKKGIKWPLTWHSTNEEVLTTKATFEDGIREVVAVGEGEAEIYATAEGPNNTTITSNRIKVKVKGLKEQNKEGVVYDLTFDAVIEGVLYATNSVTTKATHEINVQKASIVDGTNSDYIWNDGDKVLVMNPLNRVSNLESQDSIVSFDFDDQQVSSMSLYYGMFYSGHIADLDKLNEAKIRTSNDGVNWKERDILSELKENISGKNKKLLEVSFDPASKVEILLGTSVLGDSLSVAFDSIAFMADANCHMHVDKSDIVPVTEVKISLPEGTSTTIVEGKTLSFAGIVLPTTATDKTVAWHSSDETVATIDQNGKLTALKAGITEVTATSSNGADGATVTSDAITVTVKAKEYLPVATHGVLFLGAANETNETTYEAYAAELTVVDRENVEVHIEGETNPHEFTLVEKDADRYFIFEGQGEDTLKFKVNSSNDELEVMGTCGEYTFGITHLNTGNTFKKYVPATDITISCSKTTLKVGETVMIYGKVTPDAASYKRLTRINSNPAVGEFKTGDNEYIFEAKSAGETTITYTHTENGTTLTKSITITVQAIVHAESIAISSSSGSFEVENGATLQLKAELSPANVNESNLTWESSVTAIATVNSKGVVTGKSVGEAEITCRDEVSGKFATVTITVTGVSDKLPPEMVGEWHYIDEEIGYGMTIIFSSDGSVQVSDDCGGYMFEGELTLVSVEGNLYTFEGEIAMYESVLVISFDGDTLIGLEDTTGNLDSFITFADAEFTKQ